MKLQFHKKSLLTLLGISYSLSFLIIVTLFNIVKVNFRISKGDHRRRLEVVITKMFEKQFFFHPEELKIFDKHLYILAVPNNEIRVMNTKAEFVTSFGAKGDSVGQFEHVINYYPTKDTVAVADTKDQSISYISIHSRIISRTKSPEKLLRVLFLSNHKIITQSIESWNNKAHFNVFKLVDLQNLDKTEPIEVIPHIDYNGMLYDGFFTSDPKKAFFINYFYNNITAISPDGRILFRKKTIDNVPLPKVKVSERGWTTYDGNVKIVNFAAASDDKYLYILSNVQQKISAGEIGYYTDLYNVNDGSYHGSFLIPEVNGTNPGKVCLLSDKMYVLYKNHLVCYKISQLK